MARNIRHLVALQGGPFATGTSDNTITTNEIFSPSVGARLYEWGVEYTAAGTGELNPVLSIVENGLQDTTGGYGNRLANTITFNLDGTAQTGTSAVGGAVETGSFGKTATKGSGMDIRVNFTAAADTFATTDASFHVWTLWVP